MSLRGASAGRRGAGRRFRGVEDIALAFGELSALAEGPGGAGEGPDVDAVELAADLRPVSSQAFSATRGQEQGEPANELAGSPRGGEYATALRVLFDLDSHAA